MWIGKWCHSSHEACSDTSELPPTDSEISLDSTNLSERHPSWLLLSTLYLLQIFLPSLSTIYCKKGSPASKNHYPRYHWGIALSWYTPSPIRGSTFDIFPLQIQKKPKVVWKAFPKQYSTVNTVNSIWCLCIHIYLYIKLYICIYINYMNIHIYKYIHTVLTVFLFFKSSLKDMFGLFFNWF